MHLSTMKNPHIVFTFVFFFILFLSQQYSLANNDTLQNEINLAEVIQVTGGNFMIIGDGYGRTRVFSTNPPKEELDLIDSANHESDTTALIKSIQPKAALRKNSGFYFKLTKTEGTDYQQGTVGEQLTNALEVTVTDENDQPVTQTQVNFVVTKGEGKFSNDSSTITVTTDSSGKASADLILGTRTASNPVGWMETGNNTQQVGLNIVECYPVSDSSFYTVFSAYAFPDTEVAIRRHTDIFDSSTYPHDVINCAGWVYISVRDQYGNPVSNVPITVSTGSVSTVDPNVCTEFPNQDNRPALVVPINELIEDPSTPFAYDKYTQYTNTPLIINSDYAPVSYSIFTGGYTNALYEFLMNTPHSHASFTIETVNRDNYMGYETFGNCSGTEPPDNKVYWALVGNEDGGHSPGDILELHFWLYELKEYEEVLATCGSCEDIVGKTEYFIGSSLQDVTLNINGGSIPLTHTAYGPKATVQYEVPDSRSILNMRFDYKQSVKNRNLSGENCYCTTETFMDNFTQRNLSINPLIIELEPSTILSVDQLGNTLCDTDIPYTITPDDFIVHVAALTIFEDGVPFAEYPLDVSTFAPVVIAAGKQFDTTKTYTATITVNDYASGQFNGTTSNEMTLVLNEDVQIESLYVENEKENIPVMMGESITVKAVTNPTDISDSLKWSVHLPHAMKNGDQQILVDIDESTGVLTVDENSGSGTVIVRASYNDCIYAEVDVPVGCQTCEDGGVCNVEGGSSTKLSSIDYSISLGDTTGGHSAGNLILRAANISSYLYTPNALKLSSLVRSNEVIYDNDGALRQIVSGKTFVDIIPDSTKKYTINFYRLDALGTKVGEFYSLNSGATPFVSYLIENPDQSPTINNRLRIAETRGEATKVSEYYQDSEINSWSLSRGNGLSIIRKTEQIEGDIITRRETVEDGSSLVSSVVERKYKTLPWGEAIVEKVSDPSGDNLITSFEYYEDAADEGSYTKLKSISNPNGNWEYYEYDTEGRVSTKYSSWLDIAISQRNSAEVTTYNYSPTVIGASDAALDEDKNRPRVVTTSRGGIYVSNKYIVYSVVGGEKVEITEVAGSISAAYGSAENRRTETRYYAKDSSGIEADRIKSILYPDNTVVNYTYEAGSYDPATNTFTPGTGDAERVTITNGTASSPAGIANKTTREISTKDEFGKGVYKETLVYTGSAYSLLHWIKHELDDFGRITNTTFSDGTTTGNVWACCGKEAETDKIGVTTTFLYDDLKRVEYVTKESAKGDIVTHYTYNGDGRRRVATTSAQALSARSENVYDLSGRLYETIDNRNLKTMYRYENGGRKTTVTRPGGFTEITETYLDGRIKSITGTGVVHKFYQYGINADGSMYTTVATGRVDSPNWEKTTTDILGQTVRVEKPGYTGTDVVVNTYNNLGQLAKATAPSLADTLHDYDELGNRNRSGLDINNNGILDNASEDRIQGIDNVYVFEEGAWWRKSEQYTYPESNVDTRKNLGSTKIRITGLSASLNSEQIVTDIHGNKTVTSTHLERIAHRITQTVDSPDSNIDATSVSLYGLLDSVTDKSGLTTTYFYDALERRTGTTDQRVGLYTTHYNDKGEVDYTEDPQNNRTIFAYDPVTGRRSSTTDAEDNTSYFLYNGLGKITHSWGASYPVRYEYDSYGRMEYMHTYKTKEGWDSPTWPDANNALSDKTTWVYHEPSGLLESKQDALGNSTTYTYHPGGLLHERTWARQVDSADLVTTYSYDPGTGELTGIDYSDTTPDIGFNYYRTGRQKTVTDDFGSRTFIYTPNLLLESESVTGAVNYTLTRSYSNTGYLGRYSGFTLGADYSVGYQYDTTGRFEWVNWQVDNKTDSVQYGYLPDSHLLNAVTYNSGSFVTYGYEPKRDLKTKVENRHTNVVSQYDYIYDDIGRRKSMETAGDVFDTPPLPASPDVGIQETVISYTPNEVNQYSQIDRNGIVDAALYDDDGNQEEDEQFIYSWNGENRLISITPKVPAVDGDKKLEFQYDYMGRRFSKGMSSWDGANWQPLETTRFIYDGWNLIRELDGTATTKASYINGLDLSQSLHGAGGVGGILTRVDPISNRVHNYFYDANGNVGQLVDVGDGSIAAGYEYDPYGNLIASGGPYADDNPFRFSTKYHDNETGLVYYGYRYYLPELGRWVSRDPIEERDFPNLYLFNANNSVDRIDLFGLKSLIDYLEERMHYFYNNHSGQVGTKCPVKFGLDQTNCIIYCSSVIEWAYAQTGQKNVAKKIAKKSKKGTELAKYLKTLGWKGIYWNPDVNNPFDGDNEHPYSYAVAKKKKQYYGIAISDFVINYRPTPIYSNNPSKWKFWESKELDEEKMTKKDETGLKKLKRVRFGFGAARGGKHTFLYGKGSIYEVHWTGIGALGNLYEKSPFENYGWLSGVLMVPPGNGEY